MVLGRRIAWLPMSLLLITPVLMPVPASFSSLTPKERTRSLSTLAREALRYCRHGANLTRLEKSDQGVPLPENGIHWSITHKTGYVGAVAAPMPVGIDVELIRPVVDGLQRRVADDDEWALLPNDHERNLFRFWTAKEAVLKCNGRGLSDMSQCKVIRVASSWQLDVSYLSRTWPVVQFAFDGHLAAVACPEAEPWWRWLSGPQQD